MSSVGFVKVRGRTRGRELDSSKLQSKIIRPLSPATVSSKEKVFKLAVIYIYIGDIRKGFEIGVLIWCINLNAVNFVGD